MLDKDFLSPLITSTENALSPRFIAFLWDILSTGAFILGGIQLGRYIYQIKSRGPFISTSHHQLLKNILVFMNGIFVVIAFVGASFSNDKFQSYSYVFYSLVHFFIILPLHLIEPSKSYVSSSTLLLFWPLQSILVLIVFIQQCLASANHKVFPGANSFEMPLLFTILALSITIFVLEYVFYRPNCELYGNDDEKLLLEEYDILSKLTFSWMNRIIKLANEKNGQDQEDLPPPPTYISSGYSTFWVEKYWREQLKRKNPSLVQALGSGIGMRLIGSAFFNILDSSLVFLQPQLLRRFIRLFDDSTPNPLIVEGLAISFAMFCTSVICNCFRNQNIKMLIDFELSCRAALTDLIYKKAMRLAPSEKMNKSNGDIINHVSVDVIRIESLSPNFQTIFNAPTRLILCVISLYNLLGKATVVGILTMSVLIPFNTSLVDVLRKNHKKQMSLKDKRTSFITEVLQNIKSIKLYAWEQPMLDSIKHLRDDQELYNFNKIGILSALINFAWACVPFVVSCSTFAVFAGFFGIPLTPQIIFPALVLFDLLADPILAFPALITALVEINVSMNRIKAFLLSDEIDDDVVDRLPAVKQIGENSVEISNATFLWSKPVASYCDEESELGATQIPALTDINFRVGKGDLACIIGEVGAGKSTILRGLLGELHTVPSDGINSCEIRVCGSIAYCSQVPWIINGSFKENIIFGNGYNDELYNYTIKACELLMDVEMLPDGHDTFVGEKGISLSGGQKARISLARAVYSNADIYLFDDILSAVDAHVGQKLIDNVLGENGILRSKTKILATNSLKVLNHASSIYLLENKTISEFGSRAEILNNKASTIFKFAEEYGFGDLLEVDTACEVNRDIEDVVANSHCSDVLIPLDDSKVAERKTKQSTETKEKGKVKASVFARYAEACTYLGVFLTLSLVLSSVLVNIGSSYWLMCWSENNSRTGTNSNVALYVSIYALLGFGSAFCTLLRSVVMWSLCSIKGSKKLHSDMIKSVLGTSLQFFEVTPLGRIINRFSQDMNKVDEELPNSFVDMFTEISKTFFTVVIIGYNMPYFIVFILFISLLFVYYQQIYIVAVRDLKRIASISNSPIFSLIQESLSGCETIRAYDQLGRFSQKNSANIDFNQVSTYCFKSANRWLSIRLLFIGSIVTLSVSLISLSSLFTDTNKTISVGLVGFIMSYCLKITNGLLLIVRRSVEVETDIVCCERIFEYCDLQPEVDEEALKDKLITPLPHTWPSNGAIEFNNYSTRYKENLDPVLKNITFSIKSKEKIGIVGRTGSGKSSLILSLFRIIEGIEGSIGIDGLNIKDLRLFTLRNNLSIIPQDSQCIEGTVRSNLDPFNQFTDEQIWDSLCKARLEKHINNMSATQNKDPLDCVIGENGGNMSIGERQLISLARILLKTKRSKNSDLQPSKILILDEATSSIDSMTDKIIQETLRRECEDLTILTIAHRINTILDNDKILVLDKGRMMEFDTPSNLLSSPDSLFFKLCQDGGFNTNI